MEQEEDDDEANFERFCFSDEKKIYKSSTSEQFAEEEFLGFGTGQDGKKKNLYLNSIGFEPPT